MDEARDDVTVIAHRGFAGRYPENTVGAAKAAARRGASMVEIDVMPTADGTPVVIHDDTLGGRADGGLTDRSGVVWETDTETVTGASVLGTDETVPTLSAVLEAVPPGVGLNIELKNPGSDDLLFGRPSAETQLGTQKTLWRPFTERVLDIAADYDNDILVSSFSEAALATVREQAPSIPLAVLFADDIAAGVAIARTYDCEALHAPLDAVAGTPFFDSAYDADLVAIAHQAGRRLNVWTVETWYQAHQLARAGVDGIIADYPGLLAFTE